MTPPPKKKKKKKKKLRRTVNIVGIDTRRMTRAVLMSQPTREMAQFDNVVELNNPREGRCRIRQR